MTASASTTAQTDAPRTWSWKLAPAILVSLSGLVGFAFEQRLVALALLLAGLAVASVVDRRLLRDLSLIAIGLVLMGLVPITTDISFEHMAVMGAAMIGAIAIPYSLSRWVYRDRTVSFPLVRGHAWSRAEKWWLVAVVVLGYLLLPVYMIPTGVYENWPAATSPDEIFRLFLGTNALGIWDELFFICTSFVVFRTHLPFWQANVLQAVLFTSFLWELGFHAWGPLLIFPFALVQGWIFTKTKSLTYVIVVHLTFDFVLFLVLLHAHTRDWFPIFLY
ncbi:CPBP family glutamic-type intramembrane protease [Herbiconiux sp. SYSU D00978]|uniref:CPBP family glutamic-type intramembrane protease n=1 Tax=Herbiconiux sp. SYSU D00978 TaxID=2812562 RepID=UPI001A960032|nr:CPBP family intramembrane glutamic endopeptidase [Herbiconiux sp. SYSU D00978]